MELTSLAPGLGQRVHDGVAELALLRGDEGNRLSRGLIGPMVEALQRLAAEPGIRVLMLRAEGDCFCLGLDFDPLFPGDARPDLEGLRLFQQTMLALYRFPAPVIAAVDGRVEGGGIGLVAACDLVIAGPRARFMLPEVIIGMIPCLILPYLRRRLMPGALRALALSSRAVSAAEAVVIGLADEEAGSAGLARAVRGRIDRLFRSSPTALREAKRLTEHGAAGALETEMAESLQTLAGWLERPEVTEGVRLFAQGFTPPWFAKRSDRHAV